MIVNASAIKKEEEEEGNCLFRKCGTRIEKKKKQ